MFMVPRHLGSARSSYREGRLCLGGQSMRCALGRAGVVHAKREGDGGTPTGTFALLAGYFRADRETRLNSQVPLQPIHRRLGWCDDPGANQYNRPVRLPFNRSHEKLWRSDWLYNFVLVLDYNFQTRKKRAGSAIFFHIAENDLAPTAGCVAVRRADIRKILPRLAKHCLMIIA